MQRPDEVLTQNIVECIKLGRPTYVCCRAHNVQPREHDKWIKEALQEDCFDTDLKYYAYEIGKAEAQVEMGIIDEMRPHLRGDWRVGPQLLKMVNPEQYNEDVRVRVSQRIEGEIVHRTEIDSGALAELVSAMQQFASQKEISVAGVRVDDILDAEVVDERGELEEAVNPDVRGDSG